MRISPGTRTLWRHREYHMNSISPWRTNQSWEPSNSWTSYRWNVSGVLWCFSVPSVLRQKGFMILYPSLCNLNRLKYKLCGCKWVALYLMWIWQSSISFHYYTSRRVLQACLQTRTLPRTSLKCLFLRYEWRSPDTFQQFCTRFQYGMPQSYKVGFSWGGGGRLSSQFCYN